MADISSLDVAMDVVTAKVRVEKAQHVVDEDPDDFEAQKTLAYQQGFLLGLEQGYERSLTAGVFGGILTKVLDAFKADPFVGSNRSL
jgi:hypothetical protein